MIGDGIEAAVREDVVAQRRRDTSNRVWPKRRERVFVLVVGMLRARHTRLVFTMQSTPIVFERHVERGRALELTKFVVTYPLGPLRFDELDDQRPNEPVDTVAA
ncbi:MAG: hypothetical protein UY72_C0049G0002 [Candidatus Uhrbacteria bacterium GW2011_GWD2_52_7]|uniref:Uncharacterized protein n=1 Tax=Candidatus Uhrbacteria bacterium GW2011_GWD2_52_7 TaxID=1618989 RepID=A0A0G1XEK5_9BACT|nr:MAG: hypothetical protein UY72_C0049G0002 [Candidatus Uhrbacteria bacterium GW2011_GWD2_52_7]